MSDDEEVEVKEDNVDDDADEDGDGHDLHDLHDDDQNQHETKKRIKLENDTASSTTTTTSKPPKKNTAVFVSGLPDDTSLDELVDYFSKYGIIMDDMFTGGPRIKLYEREDGSFKGEALIVYLREESAQMAIEYLDKSSFRYNAIIQVSPAHFASSGTDPITTSSTTSGKVDKRKWKQHMQHMQRKLEWTTTGLSVDEEAQLAAQRRLQAKYERMVVLRGLFTAEEVAKEENPELFRMELGQEVREECEQKLGLVTSIKVLLHLFIVVVKFKESEAAAACIQLMEGRRFAGHRVSASLYDGSFSLKEKEELEEVEDIGKGQSRDLDTVESEERLDKFGEWLEEQSLPEEDDDKDGS